MAGQDAARPYRSPLRARQAAQTREAILSAAADRFASQGWSATSMRDIADAAGVSVETIYASHGPKVEVLLGAIEVAVVGDDEAVGLAERPEFSALSSGSPGERAAALARLGTAIHRRTAGLFLALREAAVSDAAAAERLADLEERRRTDLARALSMVAARPVTDEQRDGLWAITGPEVYHALTHRSGWTDDDYQTWAADVVVRLLQPPKGPS